ncbi:hypothetical protein RHSIM_RhsimUnG0221700 [Rhododendron simsii]|uniref:Transmembrane protein n=1 Tax=Rhododendron simsii TaxID=118357 RepID=A0A834FUI6_RHOSS|nr:hypothetical protein RHSIM_RhsimUnG0221700 [Rhododendron simsii]
MISNGADGPATDPDPTLIRPARDPMMASSSLTPDSSATRGHASDSVIELSGGYSSDGDRATTSSQNPNPESLPPMAQGNSASTTLLSSFLVTMVAATTVFAFTFTMIGLMLEKVHPVVATVCSYAGLIWVVLGFFFIVATFIPESFVWFVWAAGGVLVLVFVYSLAKRRFLENGNLQSNCKMIPLIIFVAILPLLPITRPKAEEGSGTSNGAEGHPADDTLIPARTLLASSSVPRDHDSASASSSSPSDEPLAGGTLCPLRPTTTTVSASNTTGTSTAACSAAPTSIVTSGRDGALNIEGPREGPRDSSNDAEIPSRKGPRDRNDDDNGPFKLAKTFLGLTFQAGLALMIYREQPPQGDSSTHLSSLSSALLTTVGATTLFAFAFTMSGMMLQRHHPNVANFCSYAGVLLGALGFFFMMDLFATEGLVWVVWAVGGILFLVFAYTLRREFEI